MTRLLLVVLTIALVASGCSSRADRNGGQIGPTTGAESAASLPEAARCGPPGFGQIAGQAPDYVPEELSAFPNHQALCGGSWLPGTRSGFVGQGLAIHGDRAWVSGYDGRFRQGRRFCQVLALELPSGRLVDRRTPITSSTPSGAELTCRHGGAIARTEEGLWLIATHRMWLLDEQTLAVRRAWLLDDPVRGSYGFATPDGRLALGGFTTERPGRLHYFTITDLLAQPLRVGEELAVDRQRTPTAVQGAVWADLDGTGRAAWFASSNTRCGVLQGPDGRRLGFIPGAEGMAVRGDRLWTISEATARSYYRLGGRPVLPTLATFKPRVAAWAEAACSP